MHHRGKLDFAWLGPAGSGEYRLTIDRFISRIDSSLLEGLADSPSQDRGKKSSFHLLVGKQVWFDLARRNERYICVIAWKPIETSRFNLTWKILMILEIPHAKGTAVGMRRRRESSRVLLLGTLVLACLAGAIQRCSGRVLLEDDGKRPAASGMNSVSPPVPNGEVSKDLATESGPGTSVFDQPEHEPLLLVFLIGPFAFLLFLLMLLVSAIIWLSEKRKRATVSPWKVPPNAPNLYMTGVPAISRVKLEAACEDFSNIIGQSPENVIFKGTLHDETEQKSADKKNGTEVAVTSIRIPAASWNGNTELYFRRKVETLARMSHGNIVNLLAYCTEEEPFERMLVFEYAPNGTLHEHLHNKESQHLDWHTRMRIVMGAAYGLQYMHHELEPPTTHLNFDANSIYLTENYTAKVADFGIPKLAPGTNNLGRRLSLTKFKNAIGYDDPEGPDFETNVLSFGVLLLETITGRTPYSEAEGSLIEWAKEYLSDPKMMWCMVDPSLKSYSNEELVAICEIARACIQPKASRRPSMKEVAWRLSNALKISPEEASSKSSPLLWAELELLRSVDISIEEPEAALNP
ncbi:hypothetical protein R1flu_023268 [Riccia fluitans]|uniref:Protein kinase domain-containing protein n=1 Tax=Riccia fluitans TaxID=41844 RepID=A0ABD1XUK9_9MARC